MYAIGYMPDDDYPDERDKDSKELLTAIEVADSEYLTRWVVKVLNQKNLGSCVSNSGVQALRMSQYRQTGEIPPLASRLFGYYNPRTYHDATDADRGTYIRFFFKALNKFGFCPESKMPYDTSKWADKPDFGVYRAAFDQKDPTDYYRIYETGDERVEAIKRAIIPVQWRVCRAELRNAIPHPPFAVPIDARVPFIGARKGKDGVLIKDVPVSPDIPSGLVGPVTLVDPTSTSGSGFVGSG